MRPMIAMFYPSYFQAEVHVVGSLGELIGKSYQEQTTES
jgi:hypothetical protein